MIRVAVYVPTSQKVARDADSGRAAPFDEAPMLLAELVHGQPAVSWACAHCRAIRGERHRLHILHIEQHTRLADASESRVRIVTSAADCKLGPHLGYHFERDGNLGRVLGMNETCRGEPAGLRPGDRSVF